MTHTNDNPSSVIAASMMLEATLQNETSLQLKRTMGGTAIDVAYEVISLPLASKQFTTSFAASETMKTQETTGFTATSSVAFSTVQAVAGQSSGSTAYADAVTLDLVGEATATLTPSGTSVSVQRASATSAASVTWNMVDFANSSCD
jgi:hypothetical protein